LNAAYYIISSRIALFWHIIEHIEYQCSAFLLRKRDNVRVNGSIIYLSNSPVLYVIVRPLEKVIGVVHVRELPLCLVSHRLDNDDHKRLRIPGLHGAVLCTSKIVGDAGDKEKKSNNCQRTTPIPSSWTAIWNKLRRTNGVLYFV